VSEQQMTALVGEPLAVEFCHGRAWHRAVLLGWRHEADGTCQVRVQFVVGGLRRTSWMQLTDVRLPESAPTTWAPPPSSEPQPQPMAVPQPRTHDDDLSWV
jgi:hypothetical protein